MGKRFVAAASQSRLQGWLKKGVHGVRLEWLEKVNWIECEKNETSAGNQEKNGKQNENEIRAVVHYQSENLAINDCICFSK
jgi:hypothetical protein